MLNLKLLDQITPWRFTLKLRSWLPFFKKPASVYFELREFIDKEKKFRSKNKNKDKNAFDLNTLPVLFSILENALSNTDSPPDQKIKKLSDKIVDSLTEDQLSPIDSVQFKNTLDQFRPDSPNTLLGKFLAKLSVPLVEEYISALINTHPSEQDEPRYQHRLKYYLTTLVYRSSVRLLLDLLHTLSEQSVAANAKAIRTVITHSEIMDTISPYLQSSDSCDAVAMLFFNFIIQHEKILDLSQGHVIDIWRSLPLKEAKKLSDIKEYFLTLPVAEQVTFLNELLTHTNNPGLLDIIVRSYPVAIAMPFIKALILAHDSCGQALHSEMASRLLRVMQENVDTDLQSPPDVVKKLTQCLALTEAAQLMRINLVTLVALTAYLKQNPMVPKIIRNQPYEVSYENSSGTVERVQFSLQYDLLRRERSNTKGFMGYCYEIMDDRILVEGGGSSLILSRGTLHFSEDDFKTGIIDGKPSHPRIVKVQQRTCYTQSEAKFARQLRHLRAKEPTVLDEKEYMVMKRMPGMDLYEISSEKNLTTKQKLRLCLAALKALKKQVQDLGIVHRDIKSENIMVYFKSGGVIPEVNIIDYGFAKEVKQNDSKVCCGTLPFTAPEILLGRGSNPKSDVYSLGKTLLGLFSENYYLSGKNEADKQRMDHACEGKGMENAKQLCKQDLAFYAYFGFYDPSLFQGESDLSPEDRKRIHALFGKMCHPNWDQRISLDDAISELTKVCRERRQAKRPSLLNNLHTLFKPIAEEDESKISPAPSAQTTMLPNVPCLGNSH